MKTHLVAQGEYLSAIARRHGFADARALCDHPANAELRRRRPDADLLLPGDQVAIPDPEPKEVACATGERHRFRLDRRSDRLRIALRDHAGEPLADEVCTLRFGDRELAARTDGEGRLEVEHVDGEDAVTLTFDERPGLVWRLAVGHLDPAHDPVAGSAIVTGVQARLNNLGFSCGAVDGIAGPRTRAALRRFQRRLLGRSDADGEIDEATRRALVDRHGC